MDDDGEEKYAYQTTYGPCISRIFAALISIHGDNKGLVLPFHLANVQVAIIPIIRKGNEEKVLPFARELGKTLSRVFRTQVDSSDNTPGFKYNYWELNGTPIRIEVGERDMDSGKAVVARRDTGEKSQVPFGELPSFIEKAGMEMNASLLKSADAAFASIQKEADNMQELKSALDSGGGFVRVPFCSDGMDAEPCAEKAKDSCSANIRGSKYSEGEKPAGKKCIGCGHPASIYLYAARQY
jgi:prolyl-tRNA synthetase